MQLAMFDQPTAPVAAPAAHWQPTVAAERPGFVYYLGARPNWLTGDRTDHDVPLFVSAATLARYTSGPADTLGAWDGFAVQTATRWALDSGAYTALTSGNENHPWHLDPDSYGALVTRLIEDMGRQPDFVAPQDWPCEASVRGITGMTVRQHIEWTVENYLYLSENFPFIPWARVIQGDRPEDYLYCEQLYLDAGVDLADGGIVGIGSICRRGHTDEIVEVIELFASRGYRMHAFGVKTTALPIIGHLLASADSYAWSDTARLDGYMLPGCAHRTRACAANCPAGCTAHLTDCRNCPRWAMEWRRRVLASMPTSAPAPRPRRAARVEQLALV